MKHDIKKEDSAKSDTDVMMANWFWLDLVNFPFWLDLEASLEETRFRQTTT